MGFKLAVMFVQHLHGIMHSQYSTCPRPLPEEWEMRKDKRVPRLDSSCPNRNAFWQKYCDDFDVAYIRSTDWHSVVERDLAELEEKHALHKAALENY